MQAGPGGESGEEGRESNPGPLSHSRCCPAGGWDPGHLEEGKPPCLTVSPECAFVPFMQRLSSLEKGPGEVIVDSWCKYDVVLSTQRTEVYSEGGTGGRELQV